MTAQPSINSPKGRTSLDTVELHYPQDNFTCHKANFTLLDESIFFKVKFLLRKSEVATQ